MVTTMRKVSPMRYTVGLLLTLLLAALCGSNSPVSAGDAAPTPLPPMIPLFSPSGRTPIVLPAVFDERVLLNTQINGHLLLLHLDTGTSTLVLGGADAKAIGVAADPTTGYTQPLTVNIGPVTARARFAILPSYGLEYDGRRISGLIGGPFFHANVVTIDYPNHRVIFYPPSEQYRAVRRFC
jgi:hypothetical protein